jgi:GNAT superfamily N-acetyltransferase
MGTLREIVFDCHCAPDLARFWAGVLHNYALRAYDDAEIARLAALGLTPDTDPTVLVDGPGPSLCFQQVPHRHEPHRRMHVDVLVGDREHEVSRLCALGASLVRTSDHYTVLADPEGNHFCVVDAAPSAGAPPAKAPFVAESESHPLIEVRADPITSLAEVGRISAAFRVERLLDVLPAHGGLGGLLLQVRPVEVTWTKDYDALPSNEPASWPRRFDVSCWGLLTARYNGRPAGAAVLAVDSAALAMLEARPGDAVLWDLRVDPELRRLGVGAALLHAAERWTASTGRTGMLAETQNVNLPACRAYARHGFTLAAIQRHAYPELPNEVRLVWHKQIRAQDAADTSSGTPA